MLVFSEARKQMEDKKGVSFKKLEIGTDEGSKGDVLKIRLLKLGNDTPETCEVLGVGNSITTGMSQEFNIWSVNSVYPGLL